MRTNTACYCAILVCALCVGAFGADVPDAVNNAPASPDKTAAATVSVNASDTRLSDVLVSLAKQANEKILVESTVKGKVTLSVVNASLETCLGAICKAANIQWRKVYIDPKSKLLEQPDRFASTVRLMSAMTFPDMLVTGASMDKVGVHCSGLKAVKAAQDTLAKDLGLQAVYLITNDTAVALAEEKTKSDKVGQYSSMSKQLMDMFMKMTPEEQEQAIIDGINQYEQMDPSYMSSAMQALMKADPDALARIASRQTEMLFHMTPEQRRAMLKMNMQFASTLTPEQMQILQEDAKAAAEELRNAAGN